MATVSDYVVVTDGTTQIYSWGPATPDSDKHATLPSFTIPSNVHRGQRAIATWMLEVEGPPIHLEWNLAINGAMVKSFRHSSDRFAAVQEVFPGSILQAGENTATLAITYGGGFIKFSNFVIHFRVDVE